MKATLGLSWGGERNGIDQSTVGDGTLNEDQVEKQRLRPRGVVRLFWYVWATNVVTTAEKRPAFDILSNEAKQRQLQTHKDRDLSIILAS